VTQKYIWPSSLQEWIRNPSKKYHVATIMWKDLVSSFDVIGDGLAWRVGKGNQVRLGRDAWPGSGGAHILSENIIQHLQMKGIFYLSRLGIQITPLSSLRNGSPFNQLGIEGEYEHLW
jgi:hypothetical protein